MAGEIVRSDCRFCFSCFIQNVGRPRMLRVLTSSAELWSQSINERNMIQLDMLLDRLGEIEFTPHEISKAKGIGSRMRASSVDILENIAIKAKIIKLRHKWIACRNLRVEFSVLAAQFLLRPNMPSVNVIVSAVYCMLELGFVSLAELDGTNVFEWSIANSAVKALMCNIASCISDERKHCEMDLQLEDKIAKLLGCKPSGEWGQVSLGPVASIKAAKLNNLSSEQKRARLENVVMETAVDSIKLSLPSYKSGLRCWLAFYGEMVGGKRPLPPELDILLYWSRFFKNSGSFSNYVTHLRWAAEACSADISVCSHPMIRRARNCVKAVTVHREKKWIRLDLVQKLMRVAVEEQCPDDAAFYALSYVFLCRVASELIPLVVQKPGGEELVGKHSVLLINENEISIKLARRKNAPKGAIITRRCFCGHSVQLCPVHTVVRWVARFENGEAPFSRLTATRAITELRRRLVICEVQDAQSYALHCFRRGHAHDMAIWGYTIRAILLAGGWRSGAFLGYMDPQDLDTAAATSYAVAQSDSEDDA